MRRGVRLGHATHASAATPSCAPQTWPSASPAQPLACRRGLTRPGATRLASQRRQWTTLRRSATSRRCVREHAGGAHWQRTLPLCCPRTLPLPAALHAVPACRADGVARDHGCRLRRGPVPQGRVPRVPLLAPRQRAGPVCGQREAQRLGCTSIVTTTHHDLAVIPACTYYGRVRVPFCCCLYALHLYICVGAATRALAKRLVG